MYQLKRILVPVDFSVHSARAMEHAVLFARRHGSEITMMHVDEFDVSPLGAAHVRTEEISIYHRQKIAYLEGEFEKLRTTYRSTGVKLRNDIKSGRAYKVIVEEGEREMYDLVVIAARGLTDLPSQLMGATAERVVRLSRQPVLSIQHAPDPSQRVTSVLCPTDLSPAANYALSYALSIARQDNAVLYVQYISELDKPEPEAEIRARLPLLTEHHPLAESVRTEYVFDRDIDPSNAIIRFADDREVSLIVMSTHGRKGLRRVFIGNNTAEVVRRSSRPVLTITHPLLKKAFPTPVTSASPAMEFGQRNDM
jgi:nucleotide-binding universal stress UspA family protein